MANSYAEQTFKSGVRTLFFGDYTCAPEGAFEEGQLYYLYVSFIYIYILLLLLAHYACWPKAYVERCPIIVS